MGKLAPGVNGNFYAGYYKLVNPEKYKGNPVEVIYRSSWEKKFMVYCDLNPGILQWESEPIKIPYVDFFGKRRNYIPDFLTIARNPNNPDLLNKFIVEIKPEHETVEPTVPQGYISPKKYKNIEYAYSVWVKNKHKWAYAVDWCNKNDYKFKIITEHYINKLKA